MSSISDIYRRQYRYLSGFEQSAALVGLQQQAYQAGYIHEAVRLKRRAEEVEREAYEEMRRMNMMPQARYMESEKPKKKGSFPVRLELQKETDVWLEGVLD
jgi:hypothetical protein